MIAGPAHARKNGLPSRHVTEGPDKAFHRCFYYAMGLDTEAIHRPMVGVASAWAAMSPAGDAPLRAARWVESGAVAAGTTPRRFATIEDADPTGDAGAVLVSRELIADSIELTMRGHCYDALVGIGASANALVAVAMAAGRLDVPCVVLPLVGPALSSGPDDYAVAQMLEAIGLAPAGAVGAATSASATDRVALTAGRMAARRLDDGTTARQMMTVQALHEALRVLGRIAAAPDLAVHVVALAHECGIALDLPAAVAVQGAATPRWRSPGEAAEYGERPARRPSEAPARWTRFLRGTLAPDGCLVTADAPIDDPLALEARVFDTEQAALAALAAGDLPDGCALVVRHQGPRGAPGMRRLARLAAAAEGRPDGPCALITDGRCPPMRRKVSVAAVMPEAADGGPLAAIDDGTVVNISPTGIDAAGLGPAAAAPRAADGRVYATYRTTVSPAAQGAVTHPGGGAETTPYRD